MTKTTRLLKRLNSPHSNKFAMLAVLSVAMAFPGCSRHKHYMDAEVHLEIDEPAPFDNMDPFLRDVAQATSPSMAVRAVREYLQAVRDDHPEPKHHLRSSVGEALEYNAFSAVQRSKLDIQDRFFDLEWLRHEPTPQSFEEIESHLERLNDAKLAAEAYGDEQLASALQNRMTGCRVALKVGRELTLIH